MHITDSSSLFDDLDVALHSGSSGKRVAVRRQITELLLSEADRLNEAQVGTLAWHEKLKIDFAKLSKPTSGCFDFWPVSEISARSVQYRFFDFLKDRIA